MIGAVIEAECGVDRGRRIVEGRGASAAANAKGTAAGVDGVADRRHALGRSGEQLACRELRRHGLRVLHCNYRCRGGEIDVIARDRDVLVFVEVRVRGPGARVGAAASVDARKRARLVLAARHFLGGPGAALADAPCRFDVVAIDDARRCWIRGAFDAGV